MKLFILSPAWPNFSAAAGIASAKAIAVQMDASASGWSLDIEKLKAAITSRTKAIFINSPSNPTGWTADREMLSEILELARKHGVWIIADEIYALFSYSGQRAPSFLDVMDPLDRVIFVNSFSKNWAMTGWRIGWLTVHPSLAQVFENLIQYSTSGSRSSCRKAQLPRSIWVMISLTCKSSGPSRPVIFCVTRCPALERHK
jgi:aspartate/methionine/tyrosine aminotransferase